MGSPGNTGCSACRFLEKPCPPDCRLAPHFPEESQDDFNSVMTTLETDNVLEMLRQHEDDSSRKRFAERVADLVTDSSPLYSAARHVLTEAMLAEAHLLDLYHHLLSINPQEVSRLNNNNTRPSTSSHRDEEEIYSVAIEALSKMSSPRVVSPPPARSPADAAALERIKDRFVDAMKMSIDKAIIGAEIGFFGMDLEVLQDYQDDDDDQSGGPNDDDGDQAVESVSNQDSNKRKD